MKIHKFITLLLTVLFLLNMSALAAQEQVPVAIDTNRKVSLNVRFQDKGENLPGANFSLYRIANVDKDGKITLNAPFDKYNVELDMSSESALAGVASTLEGYVQSDGITPDYTRATDNSGSVVFSGGIDQLQQGLYLVLGERYIRNDMLYTIQPTVVQLPSWNAVNLSWNYDVVIKAKHEAKPYVPEPPTISRKVLKVWQNKGYTVNTPKEVVVQLLKDGVVHDTVKLNAENLWRHTWDGLDANSRWTLIEQPVPNYNVTITKEGITFLVVNAYDPGDQPTPTPRPTPPPNAPTPTPKPTTPPEKLPQTGQLWWPVPMLIFAGLLLIVIGLIRRRGL